MQITTKVLQKTKFKLYYIIPMHSKNALGLGQQNKYKYNKCVDISPQQFYIWKSAISTQVAPSNSADLAHSFMPNARGAILVGTL